MISKENLSFWLKVLPSQVRDRIKGGPNDQKPTLAAEC